ncbi:MAG: polysaccharide biosynthesis C-terminal domain-containing protein, partial [Pilosibacter sp.]
GRSCRIGQSSIKNPLFGNSGRISDFSGNLFSPMAALLALAAPLMANRLILNLLQSAETIMIPERLTVYGLTRSQAVSTYGTLTGMAMPFVLFPSALVNSLAVVLLPVTARHQSAGNDSGIADGISMAFRYSLYLGIFCVGVFTVFGEALGLQIFKSQDAGSFIQILAWLCPFLYLATSSGSILNGLGKTKLTFFHHLTGMAMPFVLFPSALVNSLAVVLLPVTARHQSAGNDSGIADGISMAFRYSLYLGIFCVGVFTVFGEALGLQIFKSQDAGSFIQILAWLCPFLYLATSSGSILNGLGKTKLTFFHHLISLLVRIAFVWFGIPEFGIRACLWGMLASEMLLALLHILALRRIVPCDWNAWILIGKPVFCLLCALWLFRLFPETLPLPAGLPDFFRTAVQILLLSTMYLLFLLFFHRKQSPAST